MQSIHHPSLNSIHPIHYLCHSTPSHHKINIGKFSHRNQPYYTPPPSSGQIQATPLPQYFISRHSCNLNPPCAPAAADPCLVWRPLIAKSQTRDLRTANPSSCDTKPFLIDKSMPRPASLSTFFLMYSDVIKYTIDGVHSIV
jgi:hypothetical protein